MTDKEIRLELAKAALVGGASMEGMKLMYEWVVGQESHALDLDSIKVTELSQHLGMSAIRFENRCLENDIRTVGQLVAIGGSGFRALRLVGGGLCAKVGQVLREKYGVVEW